MLCPGTHCRAGGRVSRSRCPVRTSTPARFLGNIGGLARNGIAKLSATSGNAFSGFTPDANASVSALAVSGNEVYAGGTFSNIGGQSRNFLAALSATSGNAFSGFDPSPNTTVRPLAASPSRLHAGGPFTAVEDLVRQGYAQFSD